MASVPPTWPSISTLVPFPRRCPPTLVLWHGKFCALCGPEASPTLNARSKTYALVVRSLYDLEQVQPNERTRIFFLLLPQAFLYPSLWCLLMRYTPVCVVYALHSVHVLFRACAELQMSLLRARRFAVNETCPRNVTAMCLHGCS